MPTQKDEKILICIDDANERETLRKTIESMGFDVELTSRAMECAQKILRIKYSCVILDTELLGMGIQSAVSIIRQVDPSIPIIIATREATVLRATIQGVDPSHCLNKPLDPKNLESTIVKISRP
ncbi:MAG TPA: response regulator [Thermodesulfobacteriota bacterium]|nr:response regulator [Thermodesulfobacteriota bacterium]